MSRWSGFSRGSGYKKALRIVVKLLLTLDIGVDKMSTILEKVYTQFHQSSREFTNLSTKLETKVRLLEQTIGKE